MPRTLLTVYLKSIRSPTWQLIAPKIGRKNALGVVGAWRLYRTSNGYQSGAPITRTIEKEIVNALCSGERNRASCLLSELFCGKEDLQSGDLVHILKYCARKPDPLFVMETWNLMEEKEIPLSERCYFLTIRALCRGGYVKEAFNIVSTLEENSAVTPTLPVYSSLLQAFVKTQNLNYVNDCLHLMEHHAMGKNEIMYSLLLKIAVLQQDLSAVHEIWKECFKIYSMSIIILRKFIWAFTMLKDLESAYVALQQMVAVASQRNFHFVRNSEGKLHLSRLDIPIPYHDLLTWDNHEKNNIRTHSLPEYYIEEESNKSGFKFVMEAKEVGASGVSVFQKPSSKAVVKFLRWSFNDIIHTCASMQNITLAEQLIFQMQNLGLEPSSGTYDGYVRALVSTGGFHYGMEVLKLMQQKNLKPHVSTLAVISVSCSQALELDFAENFLDQIPECSHAYPYNALLEACDTLDQLERAIRVLAKMKHLNVTPDIRTYELLFKLFGNVNAPYEDGNILSKVDAAKRINAIELDMMKHGIQHSHVSVQNLLKSLGTEGMTKEMIQYLNVSEQLFFRGNTSIETSIYDIVLHSLVKAKETHTAIEIFKSMVSCGFAPNAAIYNIMIDCCSIIKCYRSACALVSMMIRAGFCLHRVTYTALMKVLLEFEDFGEALKLLERANSEGIQPDVVSYNTILQGASEKGRIDVIEVIAEQMHQKKIQPDTSTCANVFSAYVNNGFDTTAMEALQVLSMRMISEQDDVLEETKTKYENLICGEDLDAESRIIEVFKGSPTLAISFLHLRWCATLGFPISWSPNQSPWAKRLSSYYAPTRGNS